MPCHAPYTSTFRCGEGRRRRGGERARAVDEVDFERDLAVGRTFPLKVVHLKLLSQLNTGTRDVRRDKGYGGGRLFVVSARTNKSDQPGIIINVHQDKGYFSSRQHRDIISYTILLRSCSNKQTHTFLGNTELRAAASVSRVGGRLNPYTRPPVHPRVCA